VKSARENANLIRLNLIDEPMFLVDPPRPASAEVVPQRLGLADAFEWVELGFPNQTNQPKGLGAILLYPPGEILEACRIKFQASQ
jgi:hypothetical protein